jgi:predicted RNase H-like nuclease (RuvC/YqgF family)
METKPSTVEMENREESGTPSKKKVSKKPRIQKLKEEIVELKVLERHLKGENETLKKSFLKIRSALDQLAIKYETAKHKNKKLVKQNGRLKNMNKVLRFNIVHKNLKPKAHLRLDTIAEAALDFN